MSALGGVIALVLAGLLMWKRKLPKVAAVLLFIAGVGISGALRRWIEAAIGFVSRLVDSVGGFLLGVGALSGLIVLALAFIVIHDLLPKGKANRTTQGAAFLLPFFAVGGGVIGNALLSMGNAAGGALTSLTGIL